MVNRGLFVVFEGLDRSGKSTQVAMLYNYLLKSKCRSNLMKFPNRDTYIGKVIDSYLKNKIAVMDQVIHLLFTANRWEAVSAIREKLDNNECIVCDRYSYSGVAYSAAKATLDFQWCQVMETGLPKPDVVFYMDISTEEIAKRQGFGDEVYDKCEFQEKVRANFQKIIADSTDVPWHIIDATVSETEIHDKVVEVVQNLLK